MNHLLDDDDDLMQRRDREVTLSTGAILGIFFALVLVCGGFFAFGYNLGQKSTTAANGTTAAPAEDSSAGNFSNFKPSAGSPAGSASSSRPTSTAPTPPPAATEPAPADDSEPAQPAAASAPVVTRPAPPQPAPVAVTPAYANAAGSFVVQVAAVSHQEDATLLVGALRSKGYAVGAHTEAQDHLIHIQVGPFNNRKDAEAMRQRLLGDGYNAIVK
jgi:DedD protein